MNIIDDIKPDVKFSDVQKFVGEQVSPNDFILEMYDHSKHEVIIDEIIDNSKVGNYFINVVVKDQYGNTINNGYIVKNDLVLKAIWQVKKINQK